MILVYFNYLKFVVKDSLKFKFFLQFSKSMIAQIKSNLKINLKQNNFRIKKFKKSEAIRSQLWDKLNHHARFPWILCDWKSHKKDMKSEWHLHKIHFCWSMSDLKKFTPDSLSVLTRFLTLNLPPLVAAAVYSSRWRMMIHTTVQSTVRVIDNFGSRGCLTFFYSLFSTQQMNGNNLHFHCKIFHLCVCLFYDDGRTWTSVACKYVVSEVNFLQKCIKFIIIDE